MSGIRKAVVSAAAALGEHQLGVVRSSCTNHVPQGITNFGGKQSWHQTGLGFLPLYLTSS